MLARLLPDTYKGHNLVSKSGTTQGRSLNQDLMLCVFRLTKLELV